MSRLRRVRPTSPGFGRVRSGTGFRYVDADGRPLTDPAHLERCRRLVLPPAWSDVWICQLANGHLQATGVDAAGRTQYRYHDQWRVTRDTAKHERVLAFGAMLPGLRERLCEDLTTSGLDRERVLSCAVRLLDLGFFRVGSDQYASQNQSFGLATMRKDHVTISKAGVVTFDYTAKSGKHRVQSVADPEVVDVLRALKRRRGGSDRLLAHRDGHRWVDVHSGDVNHHLAGLATVEHCSAKDFRTWSATVLAAVGLAVSTEVTSGTARTRAVTRVVKEVAGYLGNTPAVCRASYIDPRVIDLYLAGKTVASSLDRLGTDTPVGQAAVQGEVEAAVLHLLGGQRQSLSA